MKKTVFTLLIFIFFFLDANLTFAQEKLTATGLVVDNEGVPLIGVVVRLKNNPSVGTQTKVDGTFSLDVNENEVLLFSSIGMKPKELQAKSRINVVLEPIDEKLEEVVVVGYGSAKKLSTVSGSVVKINAKDLVNKAVPNVMESLSGKVSGLQVYTSSGEPSATSSVRLHGIGSLGASSEPLYVLDGVPVSSGALTSLSQDDYESVTVLKDASSTSIYGARAANGVIYITTKKGQGTGDGVISVNAQYGFSKIASMNKFDLMSTNELLDWHEKTLVPAGISVPFKNVNEIEAVREQNIQTDWIAYHFSKNAPAKELNMSFRGGKGNTIYYVSGGYYMKDGLTANSDLKRYNGRFNIDSNIKEWLRIGATTALAYDTRHTYNGTGNLLSGVLGAIVTPPFLSPYDKDGNRLDIYNGVFANLQNPEYTALKNPGEDKKYQVNGSAYIRLTPIKGLTIKSQYGLDAFYSKAWSFRKPSEFNAEGKGTRKESSQGAHTQSLTTTVEYKMEFGDTQKLTALLGNEGVLYSMDGFSTALDGFQIDEFDMFANGGSDAEFLKKPENKKSEYSFTSFFGMLSHSYKDYLFVDLTLRSDKSSRFGKNNKTGIFYSIGSALDLKRLSLQDNKEISSFILKANYGTTGNAGIGNYAHQRLLSAGQYMKKPSIGLTAIGNPSLTWETQKKFTLGVKAGFFNEKLSVDLSLYNRITEDMLMEVPLNLVFGFSSQPRNVGSLQNRGIDLAISGEIFRNKQVAVHGQAIFNYNQEKVTKLFLGLDQWTIPGSGLTYVVGKPIQMYYPKYIGVDPADGRQQWEDPKTGEATKEFDAEKLNQTLANKYPPISGGFSLGMETVYGFSVNADFFYVYGKNMMNNDRLFTENPATFGTQANQSRVILDTWSENNKSGKFPRLGEVLQFDSHLVEDASFLRLKNLSVGYDLPKSLLAKGMSAKITLTGRNIFTFTKYKGMDPEIDSSTGMGNYPNTRDYVMGLSVNF